MSDHLPRSVISFLRSYVDHIVKLRFLLVMHRAPSQVTSVPMAARELEVPKSQVRDMANELAEDGLVRISADRLELAPRSIEDRLAISDLAFWYTRDRAVLHEVLRALGR
jgi:hypothetical protein